MKKALFAFVLLLSFYGSAPAQDTIKIYQKLMDSVTALREQKKYLEGIKILHQAIQIYPHDKYWRYLDIAVFASLAGEKDSAFVYLNKVFRSPIPQYVYWKYYLDNGLHSLYTDPRWLPYKHSIDSVIALNKRTEDSIKHARDSLGILQKDYFQGIQDRMEQYASQHLLPLHWKRMSSPQLYDLLQKRINQFPFKDTLHDLCFYITLHDTFRTSYIIHLPHHFSFNKKYPLLIVLHGAVRYNHPPQLINFSKARKFFFKPFFKLSDSLGYISVYPFASPQYNWMTNDKGFELIPDIIEEMKRCFNVEDSKVYISGHSNGATGSFNYLLKDPTPFAAFSGFNNKPIVMTGGTFIKNAINGNFYNIATDKDYYFPLEGHLKLARIADSLGIDWHNDVYYGFPHWFPAFPQAEIAFKHIFSFMENHVRNPFPSYVYWQCDDIKHGRCDWLAINQLDTLETASPWQKPINFTVTNWVNANDTSKITDSTVDAFNFPRKSGAIEAHYRNNIFHLSVSCVKGFTLFLSPEMIDFRHPIKIFINGKKVCEERINYDKSFMLRNFEKYNDQQMMWVNEIIFQYKKKKWILLGGNDK